MDPALTKEIRLSLELWWGVRCTNGKSTSRREGKNLVILDVVPSS